MPLTGMLASVWRKLYFVVMKPYNIKTLNHKGHKPSKTEIRLKVKLVWAAIGYSGSLGRSMGTEEAREHTHTP